DLLNVRPLTMWALDVLNVALFEAQLYDKRPITRLTVIFIHRHARSLQIKYEHSVVQPMLSWTPLAIHPAIEIGSAASSRESGKTDQLILERSARALYTKRCAIRIPFHGFRLRKRADYEENTKVPCYM